MYKDVHSFNSKNFFYFPCVLQQNFIFLQIILTVIDIFEYLNYLMSRAIYVSRIIIL